MPTQTSPLARTVLPLLLILPLVLPACAPAQGALFDMGVASERSQSDLRARTLQIEEQRIHYLEREGAGSDAETVVLIHGFAGSKDHWVRLVRHLPARYRVLIPDLPGHGDNEPDTTTTYSIAFLAQSTWSAVSSLSDGPVVLVGNSLGGRTATEMALLHPDRVRGLVLLNPSGLPSPEPSGLDNALQRGENWLIPTSEAAYDSLTALAFGDNPPDLPWPARSVIARRYAARALVYQTIWDDLGAHDEPLADRLRRLRAPVLLLWGTEDDILHPSAAAQWGALVPTITTELLEGVGHAPMLEQPEATAERLARFIQQLLD